MSLAHSIASPGGLLIRYPSQVVVHSPLKVTVDASAYGIDLPLAKPDIDDSARQILFACAVATEVGKECKESAFAKPLIVKGAEQQLSIVIEGLANPYDNEESSSFEIITFTRDKNVLYFIDAVE